jgi:hypothetical protein
VKHSFENPQRWNTSFLVFGVLLSSGDKRIHFGLGKEERVESIEIRWPSGIVQTFKSISADQILQIDEPVAPAKAKPAAK